MILDIRNNHTQYFLKYNKATLYTKKIKYNYKHF